MRVLLITQWGTGGGISTHVTRLVEHSKSDFDTITYPRFINVPFLRAFSFVLSGFIRGIFRNFDIIHAHYTVPQGFLGLLLKYFKRRPLVITVHGSDITVLSKNPAARPILRFVLKNADRVVAVSNFLKEEIKKLGVPQEKIEVIYGGVTISEDGKEFDAAGRVITFVGSLVPQKGVDTLIESFKDIKTEGTSLIIVGDGPERKRLEALAEGIGDIQFLGRRKGIKNILTKSDVLVLPSKEEGFGLVLLEAMVLGTPVIATNVGGIPEIVEEGVSGILVEKDNPKQLAVAIDRVLGDEELGKTLVENGREKAKKFTWEMMCGEIDELYESIGTRA
jgi:N-acetyl-alpha-D-glucosaminyl L-malate synthase BshA